MHPHWKLIHAISWQKCEYELLVLCVCVCVQVEEPVCTEYTFLWVALDKLAQETIISLLGSHGKDECLFQYKLMT